ncbi:MAG: PAS domain-containing protein [Acidimicrobiia bacterium]
MDRPPHKSLVLILARQLAANLATPVFCVDPEGTLVYYNEPAERVLGREFSDAGELTQQEWGTIFSPLDSDGQPVAVGELPLSIALAERRPAHQPLRITGLNGKERFISVTAFPLFARADELVGAMAIFWEE